LVGHIGTPSEATGERALSVKLKWAIASAAAQVAHVTFSVTQTAFS
jgi:hypothetical protein